MYRRRDHPIMDGQKHRIGVDGDRKGDQAGFYVCHMTAILRLYQEQPYRHRYEMEGQSYSLTGDKGHIAGCSRSQQAKRAAKLEETHEVTSQRITDRWKIWFLLPKQPAI